MKDKMSAKEFRELLAKGLITKGRKGRLSMSETVFEDGVFNEDVVGIHPDLAGYIFIPGRVYSSKNSKRIGIAKVKVSNWKCKIKGVWQYVRPTLRGSQGSIDYKKKTRPSYKRFQTQFLEMAKDKAFPLYIEFVFVVTNKGVWDWNNLTQAVQDQMVEANWLPDDSVKYMLPVVPIFPRSAYFVDKGNEGVYIKVKDVNNIKI